MQNLTLVFLYLYNFTNALSSSDISARYFGVNKTLSPSIIQLFQKDCRKNCACDNLETGDMGYDQYTVADTVAVESTFVAFP